MCTKPREGHWKFQGVGGEGFLEADKIGVSRGVGEGAQTKNPFMDGVWILFCTHLRQSVP